MPAPGPEQGPAPAPMPGCSPGAGPSCGQAPNPPAWSSRTGRCCRWRRCWPGIPPHAECRSCVTAARCGMSRWRPRRSLERRLMRGAGVRVVAVSNFTAGALLRDCRATVLPPALSREWFDTLAAAAADRQDRGPGYPAGDRLPAGGLAGQGTPSAGGSGDGSRPPGCQPDHLRQREPADRPAAPGLRILLVHAAAGPQRRGPRSRAGCGGLVRAGHADQERPRRRRRGFRPCPA